MDLESLFPGKPFEIKYGSTTVYINPVELPDRLALHASFSSSRKPIVVIRAHRSNGDRFWTSVPEGRQSEAEGIGKLIEDYLKQNLK